MLYKGQCMEQFNKQRFIQKNQLIFKLVVCQINLLAGQRITFCRPHQIKNEKMLDTSEEKKLIVELFSLVITFETKLPG